MASVSSSINGAAAEEVVERRHCIVLNGSNGSSSQSRVSKSS